MMTFAVGLLQPATRILAFLWFLHIGDFGLRVRGLHDEVRGNVGPLWGGVEFLRAKLTC